jgi:hypothetical protein
MTAQKRVYFVRRPLTGEPVLFAYTDEDLRGRKVVLHKGSDFVAFDNLLFHAMSLHDTRPEMWHAPLPLHSCETDEDIFERNLQEAKERYFAASTLKEKKAARERVRNVYRAKYSATAWRLAMHRSRVKDSLRGFPPASRIADPCRAWYEDYI